MRGEFCPEMGEEGVGALFDDDVADSDPPRPFRLFPVPGKDGGDELHDLFFREKGGEEGPHQGVPPPLSADTDSVSLLHRFPSLGWADLDAVAAVNASVRGKDGFSILPHFDGPLGARLGAEAATDARL